MKIAKTRVFLALAVVMLGVYLTSAASVSGTEVPVGTMLYNGHQAAGEENEYRFMARTRLRINSTNSSIDFSMDVDAVNIGDKLVTIEINCTEDVEMNMTCRETMDGLQNGMIIRNRHRIRENFGFAANISVNCTNFTARLKAEVGSSRSFKWAYLDGDRLVEVPTTYVDGEAIAEVDHFSTWVLISNSYVLEISLVVAGLVTLGVIFSMHVMKKRR
ncbi:MAG: hypothetical protein ACTSUE_25820 [Promethearchaeota archaeon]